MPDFHLSENLSDVRTRNRTASCFSEYRLSVIRKQHYFIEFVQLYRCIMRNYNVTKAELADIISR